jgi:hypothetical protein
MGEEAMFSGAPTSTRRAAPNTRLRIGWYSGMRRRWRITSA